MLFHKGARHKVPTPMISAPPCTYTVGHPVGVLQFSELRQKKNQIFARKFFIHF